MTSFRIATFNAHHGVAVGEPYRKHSLLASIDSLEADVICLQELDTISLRTRFENQPAVIAEHLGYSLVSSCVRFFGLGFQHNTIVTRLPIVSSEDISLPKLKGKQSRTFVSTVLDTGEGILRVSNTHLNNGRLTLPNPTAEGQLEFFLNYLDEASPAIAAGDFNLCPDDVVPIAEKYNFDAPHEYPTSPASRPRHQIDWILGRGVTFKNVFASEKLASDHRALIADIEI